jgi:transporter family protein
MKIVIRLASMDFRIWALLSALFAGVTAVLAKKGVDGVPANMALLVRVGFVLIFSLGLAVATKQAGLSSLTRANWIFLGLSAVATWLSWLCYFRALQQGDVARVAPIDKLSFVIAMLLGIVFLREKVDAKLIAGAAMIVGGVLLTLK